MMSRRSMMMKWVGCAVLVGSAAWLAGCSTPSSRARAHGEAFEELPATVQRQLKKGRVEPGFTKDMVRVALGKPDRVYRRKTATGQTEVWSYVGLKSWTDRQQVSTRGIGARPASRRSNRSSKVWAEVEQKREYEVLRVEFQKGVVVAVEELKE